MASGCAPTIRCATATCWSRCAIPCSTIRPGSDCVGEIANLVVSALDGVVAAGRYGRRTGDPGVVVSEVRGVGLATVTARKGRRGALVDAARATFGVELPSLPRCVAIRDIAFIWSGPDQWLACRYPAPTQGMEASLGEPFAGLASIVDQSHGRT